MGNSTYTYVGAIGDKDPIAHRGGFVYIHEGGKYAPHIEWFEPGSDEDWHDKQGKTPLKVYRFDLDRARFRTNGGYNVTTGQYDKVWHSEWFVEHLDSVASSSGVTKFQLLRGLLSKDPMTLARAYWDLIGHFGAFEFDQYPLDMTEDEAYARYANEMKQSLGITQSAGE